MIYSINERESLARKKKKIALDLMCISLIEFIKLDSSFSLEPYLQNNKYYYY